MIQRLREEEQLRDRFFGLKCYVKVGEDEGTEVYQCTLKAFMVVDFIHIWIHAVAQWITEFSDKPEFALDPKVEGENPLHNLLFDLHEHAMWCVCGLTPTQHKMKKNVKNTTTNS